MTPTCIYFDCFSGAAGDMLLGALLDMGASVTRLQTDLDTLGIPGLKSKPKNPGKGG